MIIRDIMGPRFEWRANITVMTNPKGKAIKCAGDVSR